MNRQAIWAIARKDMRSVTSNAQVWGPMIAIPLIFTVIMPAVLLVALANVDLTASKELQDLTQMIEMVASGPLRAKLETLPQLSQQIAFMVINYTLAPFFLMIPLMAGTSVAAQSFAGEKERGTLESLLFAPVDLMSLFVGKILGGFLPAVGLSYLSFLVYAVLVNLLGWPLFGGLFFPQWHWAPMMLLLVPMISLGAVLFSVYISSRVATFQAAYQMSSMVVLPMVLLLVGQVTGILLLDLWLVTAIGVVLGIINLVLLKLMAGKLNRGYLFESQIR